jgi:hypothetical protein
MQHSAAPDITSAAAPSRTQVPHRPVAQTDKGHGHKRVDPLHIMSDAEGLFGLVGEGAIGRLFGSARGFTLPQSTAFGQGSRWFLFFNKSGPATSFLTTE